VLIISTRLLIAHTQLGEGTAGCLGPQIHTDFNEIHAETVGVGPSRPAPLHNSSTGSTTANSLVLSSRH